MDDPAFDDAKSTSRWRQQLDRALPAVIGVSLLITIGALLYFASIAARDQARALQEQQRSYEVMALARRLDGSIAKAESMLGRYVISMDKNIGRQYQDKWKTASTELSALRRATYNDPVQHKLVEQLEAAYRERSETLTDIALRTAYDQKETSLGKFYQASKAPSLARITSLLAQIIETENDRLTERNLIVQQAGNSVQQVGTTYRLVGLVLLIALLILGWFARSIMRARRREQQMIEEEYRRAEALEAAVAARTEELRLAYAKLQKESSDLAKAEESLRQMQKMEAVGQLTGGIAHDFNNMLTVVVGGLELARNKLGDKKDVIRHIDNAMEGANRASALTRRLLAFARSEPHLPAAIKPDDLVNGMIELLDRSIGDQIAVELDLHASDWSIYVDRHQLENVLLNLAVNARDAMEGRGTITLRTGQTRLRAGEVGDCPAGEYIALSVIDNGSGMTPEVLDRVFEPFFTTKDIGKGTGLGLSQVFGFVRQSGGEIHISSTPGEGTQVQIYLPRHQSAGKSVSPASANLNAPSMHLIDSEHENHDVGKLTILVVEDDPRVLAQTRSALLELGHRPLCCDHPHKAVATLEANSDIQLILTDVMMPDMTGFEMIAALPKAYRTLPVVFVTGYAGDITDNSMFEDHLLLRKPYTLATLKQIIAQAISQSRASEAISARALQQPSGDDAAARA